MSTQDQGPEQPYGPPPGYGQQYGPYGPAQYAQPYPQQPYGPGYPQAGYGPYRPAVAPTCGLAVATLVLGIVGLLVGPAAPLVAVPALFMGGSALRRIRERGEQGRGLVVAGVILSVIGLIMAALWIIFIVYVVHQVHDYNNAPLSSTQ